MATLREIINDNDAGQVVKFKPVTMSRSTVADGDKLQNFILGRLDERDQLFAERVQKNIDDIAALKAAADVVNIYEDKAAFDADKANLEKWITDLDIIKILHDTTEYDDKGQPTEKTVDDRQTYMQVTIDSSKKPATYSWKMIGELLPYYSIEQIDAMFDALRPKWVYQRNFESWITYEGNTDTKTNIFTDALVYKEGSDKTGFNSDSIPAGVFHFSAEIAFNTVDATPEIVKVDVWTQIDDKTPKRLSQVIFDGSRNFGGLQSEWISGDFKIELDEKNPNKTHTFKILISGLKSSETDSFSKTYNFRCSNLFLHSIQNYALPKKSGGDGSSVNIEGGYLIDVSKTDDVTTVAVNENELNGKIKGQVDTSIDNYEGFTTIERRLGSAETEIDTLQEQVASITGLPEVPDKANDYLLKYDSKDQTFKWIQINA